MQLYQLQLIVPLTHAEVVAEMLSPHALYVATDLLNEAHAEIAASFSTPPDTQKLALQLAILLPQQTPNFTITALPYVDWLAATARTAGAGQVGHLRLVDAPSIGTQLKSQKAIYVESWRAFGDGYHATTRGCLLALGWLAQRGVKLQRVADIGCGTAVLALAAHKLWPQLKILASDIDADAVRLAAANAQHNGAGRQVRPWQAAGFAGATQRGAARFDLICMNILAGPLVQLARHTKRHLAAGGYVILSGMLASQQRRVLAAYALQGLRLRHKYVENDWVTLVLKG